MLRMIVQAIVRVTAAPMLHLLYNALQSLLLRGIIPHTHRIRRIIYGDIIYMYGLYKNAAFMSPRNKALTER